MLLSLRSDVIDHLLPCWFWCYKPTVAQCVTDLTVTWSDVMTNIMLIGGLMLGHYIFGPDVKDHLIDPESGLDN